MKKLFAWLTGSVVKEIGNAIDKLTTTKEEKLIIKKQVLEILEKAGLIDIKRVKYVMGGEEKEDGREECHQQKAAQGP